MKLPKDLLTQTYKSPDLFLCETDKARICKLDAVEMSASLKFNTYSELTCTIGRTYVDATTGKTEINPYYNKIEALRLLYLDGFGYFEIQDPEIVNDGIREIKNITAYSLEYNLSQKYLETFHVNTGEVTSIEVIYAESNNVRLTPITFYNKTNPNLSLLHLVLEKIYGWTIGHVDVSLQTMSRTFEISRESVYDFLVHDLCEKFNCFIVFDTINNEINFYAESLVTKFIGDDKKKTFVLTKPYEKLDSVSVNGYKTTEYIYNSQTGELTFNDTSIPEDGALIEVVDGAQASWQTDVYITFDNLAQEVSIDYNADDIKTVLTVKGADDLDIREVNFGLPYIVDLSYYYNPDWMGQDLYDAYTKYLQICDDSQLKYTENSKNMLELDGHIAYETSRLALEYSIADNVTSTTVGTYYVKYGNETTGYYYKEVQLPDEYNANIKYYMLDGSDLNEDKFSKLYAAIRTYFVSEDDKDVTEIDALEDSFMFMKTNTIKSLSGKLKNATNLNTKDAAILTFFDEMWNQLGLTPLNLLYLQPYQEIKSANIDAGWNDTSNENYWRYYPVTLVIKSLEDEITSRESTIAEYQEQYYKLQTENSAIANATSIYNYFSPKQLARLSPFLREDEYTDNNFVETDLDTIESLMNTKYELLQCGKIELSKLCSPKLKFSMDMANIFALPEFEPIIDQFDLGYLINVVIRRDDEQKRGYIKCVRLLEVNINFKDFSDFSCVFGELSERRAPSNIHADLLAGALSAGKSVASNASYWNKGTDLAISTDLKIQQGLLDAIDGLYSSTQNASIDKNGIHLTSIDPSTGEISPRQGWIVNNKILYSSDGFKTARTGLGEFTINGTTFYGLLADAVLAGYIEGSTIVGGTIDIGDGIFKVTSDGRVVATNGEIAGWSINDNYLDKKLTIDNTDYRIYLQAPNGDTSINAFAVRTKDVDSTKWETQFAVDYKGKLTAKNATIHGSIHANDGTIGGWTIYDHLLRKEVTVDSVDYQMYMQAADGVSTSNAFAVRKKNSNDTSWDVQFAVNYAGKLTAKNATITGTIHANDGTIGNWNITSNAISKDTSKNGTKIITGMQQPDSGAYAFFAGTYNGSNYSDCEFKVTHEGKLYASGAAIDGKITATSGSITGDMTVSGSLTHTSGNYTVTLRGVQSNKDHGVFYITDKSSGSNVYPFIVNGDGSFKATKATITGDSTFGGTLNGADGIFKGKLSAVSGTFTSLSAGKSTFSTNQVKIDASYVNSSGEEVSKGSVIIGQSYVSGWEDITIMPSANNLGNIGTANRSWDMLYVKNGAVQSSDRNYKKDISVMGEKQERLFNLLSPVTFKFIDSTYDRLHYGFISQEVEDAIVESGLTTKDFAGFCKDIKRDENGLPMLDENGDPMYIYSLRYNEFIALNTHMIQKLQAENRKLEERILLLEEKIEQL